MIVQPVNRPRVDGLRPRQIETPPPAGGLYSADPLAVETEVNALAGSFNMMGVPLDSDTAEAQAVELLDPDAIKAQANATISLDSPFASGVVSESGVTVAGLQARTAQIENFLVINGRAGEAEAQAVDGQRVMAKVQRDLRGDLGKVAGELLRGTELAPADRTVLEAFLRQISQEQAQAQAQALKLGQKTSADNASSAAQQAGQAQREQALRTIVNLKNGGSASPEDIQTAYEVLMNGAAPAAASDRRSGGR